MSVSLANIAKTAAADALLALANGGSLKIYNSNDDLLVSITLDNPAWDGAVNGVAALASTPLTGTAGVGGSGNTTAAYYKVFKSDGTTVVFSETTVTSLGLATTTIVENDVVQINSLPFTHN